MYFHIPLESTLLTHISLTSTIPKTVPRWISKSNNCHKSFLIVKNSTLVSKYTPWQEPADHFHRCPIQQKHSYESKTEHCCQANMPSSGYLWNTLWLEKIIVFVSKTVKLNILCHFFVCLKPWYYFHCTKKLGEIVEVVAFKVSVVVFPLAVFVFMV